MTDTTIIAVAAGLAVAAMLWCFSDVIADHLPDGGFLARGIGWTTIIVPSVGIVVAGTALVGGFI